VVLADNTRINAPIVINVSGPHSMIVNRMAGADADMTITTKPVRQEVVHVASAMLDERFSVRASVKLERIEAVLCVPLTAPSSAGVVYLQNLMGGGSFSSDDVTVVRTVAEYLGTLTSRLLELNRRRLEQDCTAQVRKRVRTEGLIGRSAALAGVLERLELLASMDANVLITGPSGTGKSFFAHLLHQNSARADAPFIALNCAALPEGLVENELFGAERGAHSTAAAPIGGKVATAEGGTLFLDEVGELPLAVQAKVLQLVQNREYYPLGGTRAVQANVRIITATNRELEHELENNAFRKDLYYRIRGVQLRVPPLVERREDIPLLVEYFCAQSCERNGLQPLRPSPAALVAAEFSDWPGNVRELASACEEAVVNARLERALEIEPHHLFPSGDASEAPGFHESRQQWECSYLEKVLSKHDWNVAQSARALRISRSHLNAMIRRCELRRGAV
ncbi:MAG: sigma-54-dependent Fis family transcriptional regulator, partial [Nannocystaceae bacterium]|nr:sigma-54-dependent Fis family transcriptional regulator [Nannocystaceae bacterium]